VKDVVTHLRRGGEDVRLLAETLAVFNFPKKKTQREDVGLRSVRERAEDLRRGERVGVCGERESIRMEGGDERVSNSKVADFRHYH
jgi:hypothetical protein